MSPSPLIVRTSKFHEYMYPRTSNILKNKEQEKNNAIFICSLFLRTFKTYTFLYGEFKETALF